jgi:hypothetical protein
MAMTQASRGGPGGPAHVKITAGTGDDLAAIVFAAPLGRPGRSR